MFWLVTQKSLHRCRLELDDSELQPASVFPFFDGEGRTRSLMITAEESGHIWLVPWRANLFARRWLHRNRLQLRRSDLVDLSGDEAERSSELWHFDPWWVLGEQRYHAHIAVPHLKRTNIPGYDDGYTQMWFSGSLDRVVLTQTGKGEEAKLRRFRRETLADAAQARGERVLASTVRRDRPMSWRLRPFWE